MTFLVALLVFEFIAHLTIGSQVLYQKALVHEDSIIGQAMVAEEWWNPAVCSQLCNKKTGCNGFYKSIRDKCLLITNLKPEALVETSPLSVNRKYIFYASPTPVERTSHFLIIHYGGAVEDFSEDPDVSPPIRSYPLSHSLLGENSAYVLDENKTLTMIQENGGTSMFQWSFDNQSIVTVSSIAPKHGSFAGWAAQNNVLFINGGENEPRLSSIYKNGQFVPELVANGYQSDRVCVTFVPDDNYFVYLIGGRNPKTDILRNHVLKYDIEEDQYELIANVPIPNDDGVGTHGCTGVRVAGNKKALVVHGGDIEPQVIPEKRGSTCTILMTNHG